MFVFKMFAAIAKAASSHVLVAAAVGTAAVGGTAAAVVVPQVVQAQSVPTPPSAPVVAPTSTPAKAKTSDVAVVPATPSPATETPATTSSADPAPASPAAEHSATVEHSTGTTSHRATTVITHPNGSTVVHSNPAPAQGPMPSNPVTGTPQDNGSQYLTTITYCGQPLIGPTGNPYTLPCNG